MASLLARFRSVSVLCFVLGCAGGAPPSPSPAASAPTAKTSPTPAASPAADASTPSDAGPKTQPWPYQTPAVVRGGAGMVVSDNAIASKVGRDVLAAGG